MSGSLVDAPQNVARWKAGYILAHVYRNEIAAQDMAAFYYVPGALISEYYGLIKMKVSGNKRFRARTLCISQNSAFV
jgi:hypothetical protein